MQEQAILQARIGDMLQQVNRVESAIAETEIDAALRNRVAARFERLLRDQRRGLEQIGDDVNNGVDLTDCWSDFEERRGRCEPVFEEAFAFVEGALARRAGLDAGMCRLADALLDELSRLTDHRWQRFTVLAPSEFFYDMAEIVRIRFQDVGLWNLPIAAHEFGHFVAQELERGTSAAARVPFERAKQAGPSRYAHTHEHFADVFATYTLGPAFAATCMVLRLDPAAAASQDHPSGPDRVSGVIHTLQLLEESGGIESNYAQIRGRLGESWQRLRGDGETDAATDGESFELEDLTEELFTICDDEMPAGRYQGWLRAAVLASEFSGGRRPRLMAPDITLPDVLNAAWIARLEPSAPSPERIGELALAVADEVLARSPLAEGAA